MLKLRALLLLKVDALVFLYSEFKARCWQLAMGLHEAQRKGGEPSLRMIKLSLGNVVVSPLDDEKQDIEDCTCLISMASE